MKKFLVLFYMFYAGLVGFSQNSQEIEYTLADRDRLIVIESRLEAVSSQLDRLSENQNNRTDRIEDRIDRLEDKFDTYFTWGFGLVLGAIFALFGFIIYDRRTTLAPVRRDQERLLSALREIGQNNPQVKEALKKVALW